jgi:hypothetical protein
MARGAIPVLTLAALLFASPASLGSLSSFTLGYNYHALLAVLDDIKASQ